MCGTGRPGRRGVKISARDRGAKHVQHYDPAASGSGMPSGPAGCSHPALPAGTQARQAFGSATHSPRRPDGGGTGLNFRRVDGRSRQVGGKGRGVRVAVSQARVRRTCRRLGDHSLSGRICGRAFRPGAHPAVERAALRGALRARKGTGAAGAQAGPRALASGLGPTLGFG